MKPALAILLIASLVLASPLLQTAMALQPVPQPAPQPSPDLTSFCDSKCSERCTKAGYKKRCMDYCGICCKKCKCVPSGTYGNKSECPCYRDMLNTKGTSKCP